MWKFEEQFRKDNPQTIGETDKHFDLDNYKYWLENKLDAIDTLPLQTKLEMFYDFLFERGMSKQISVGIDTIVKNFIDEKLS
jgi:hypothetical protein